LNARVQRLTAAAAAARDAAARFLVRLRLSPTGLTLAGFVLSVAAGCLFYAGLWRTAAVFLALAGFCDLFDGAVARVSGRVTDFGAFLDSTVDRLSDAAVLGGILLYYSRAQTDTYMVLAAFLALVGSFLVSYTRARAECIIERCRVGLCQRPERVVALAAAGLFGGIMPAVLWLLAAATGLTVLQRILYVRRALRDDRGGPNSGTDTPSGAA
jgi:CDP-diacylglycerol--glycerol-3-phosphate 3-phosphatidyltransferase